MPAVAHRGRGRRTINEINMVPFIDVMLVLLIIFMVSAPLLNVGVPVELPKTEASAVDTSDDPISVSVNEQGQIYVGDTETRWESLPEAVAAAGGANARERPIFLRADGRAPYQAVARVMARLSANGFTKMNLITDTASSAPATPVAAPAAGLRQVEQER